MDRVLNFNILANPANWIIIFLILYGAGVVAHALYSASQGANLPISLPQGL